MMSMVLPRTCCCGPKVRQWTASLCSNACVVTCSGTGAICIPEITFCDSYRESIGLPKALDTEKCYIMILGGCLFVVNDPTYVSSCNDTPTSTRNIGILYGVFDQPEDGGCDEICTGIKDDDFLVGPDVWTGGFACGTPLTLTYQWPDAYCRDETFTTNGSCSPICIDPCVKKIGTIVSAWSLGQFPDQWYSNPVQCSLTSIACTSCGGYLPSGYPFGSGRPQNHQIGSNLCPNIPLCTLAACNVNDSFTCFVQPVASEFRVYEQALTITRSCVYPIGDGTGWIDLGPGSNVLGIDTCVFRNLEPGCKASTLATAINNALGQASQVGSTTFVAVGTDAWIGNACVYPACAVSSACLPSSPYLWDGPYYSNSGKTATWYAAPWLTYQMASNLVSSSFIRNFSDSGCSCGGGDGSIDCFGIQYQSTDGYYVSNNYPDNSGPVIEYGVTFNAATFTMIDNPIISNQPCCPPPGIS